MSDDGSRDARGGADAGGGTGGDAMAGDAICIGSPSRPPPSPNRVTPHADADPSVLTHTVARESHAHTHTIARSDPLITDDLDKRPMEGAALRIASAYPTAAGRCRTSGAGAAAAKPTTARARDHARATHRVTHRMT